MKKIMVVGLVAVLAVAGLTLGFTRNQNATPDNEGGTFDNKSGGMPSMPFDAFIQVGSTIERDYMSCHIVVEYLASDPEQIIKITVDDASETLKVGSNAVTRGSLHTVINGIGLGAFPLNMSVELSKNSLKDTLTINDNDNDGKLAEDPEDNQDNDGDGLIDEDPQNTYFIWTTDKLWITGGLVASHVVYDENGPQYMPPHPSLLENGPLNWVEMGEPAPHHSTVVGTQNILVMRVDFPDTVGTQNTAHYQNLLFGEANSLREYYREVSYGRLSIEGSIVGDGWYRSANNMTWWGDDLTVGNDVNNDAANGNIYGLVREAIQLADADVNFADYDRNGNNVIEPLELNIVIVHAGHDQASTGQEFDIWSHRWSIAGTPLVVDGVRVSGADSAGYMMVAEDSPLGTFAHEFGHMLGLPDLYDTDDTNGTSEGVGEWDLMGSGGWLGGGNSPAQASMPRGTTNSFARSRAGCAARQTSWNLATPHRTQVGG